MKYLYYPGCSLRGTGRAYEESLLAVFRALQVDLQELDDWNCCGAQAYMAVDERKAVTLAARNLAIADGIAGDGGTPPDLLAPCSACYLNLYKAQRFISERGDAGAQVRRALESVGLHYRGAARIRHPLDVLVNDIGVDAIAAGVTHPLRDLKVAPYYGCQVVRPYATFDDQRNPTSMDRLIAAAGATVVDYPLKTRCCGGSLTGTITDVGQSLVALLLKEARARGADAVCTVCPLCQFNLEAYQDDVERAYRGVYGEVTMPVVYVTQVLGLALGVPARDLGLQHAIVPLEPALARRELVHA